MWWWKKRRIIKEEEREKGEEEEEQEKEEEGRKLRRRKKRRPGLPEDKQIQSTKCCVLLCPVRKHYGITMITVAQAFGLATRQLTLV
jgi:hypothetical protein